MSARDDLNRYEYEWSNHLEWRKPHSASPGTYTYNGGAFRTEYAVRFDAMPSALRERVKNRLEPVIAAMVDEEHEKYLAELRARAVAEAQATLAELTGPSGPNPILPAEPGQPVEAET